MNPKEIRSLKDLKDFVFYNADFLILVLVFTAIVFANSLGGDFVSDDVTELVKHPLTQDLVGSLKTFKWQRIVYAVIYQIFGLNEIPFHIYSLGLHLGVVGLVFIIVSLFLPTKVSRITIALFAVHPLVTEAVSWISANYYLYCAIITLVSLILYTLFFRNKNKWYYVSSVGIYLVGVLLSFSIQLVIMIPLMVVLLDQLILHDRFNLKKITYYIPYFLITPLPPLALKTHVATRVGELVEGQTSYWLRASYSSSEPLKLLFWPQRLSLYHDGEYVSKLKAIIMGIVLVSLVIGIPILIKKSRKIAGIILLGYASFVYALSPIQFAWFVADRYIYVAVISFCLLVALFFVYLEKELRVKNLALILTLLLLIPYTGKTISRNSDWATRKSLWEATARTSPLSFRVYNNLGDVYAKEGNLPKSVEAFQMAVKINPQYSEAYHNLGNTFLAMGEIELAKQSFEKALSIKYHPKTEEILNKINSLAP